MTTQKLTLTASPEVVSLAKELAKKENTSVSAMFANFIMAQTRMKTQTRKKTQIGPLTKALSGVVKLSDDFDEKQFIENALVDKFGLVK
ncbi:MAG: DUF6364 family protein [Lentisphaeria bacterium]|jgi:hypothetical protein|nr:DUF6364 family protein [Lentisphaeria bacterium]